MILYAHTITARLEYIASFIGTQIGGTGFISVTSAADQYKASSDCKINYSDQLICEGEFFLPPSSLLFEDKITTQNVNCFDYKGHKAFFPSTGDFSFDIFAASFYLLSRYEEYLPHEKDIYGRYAHENSLAYREGFLHIPLINIWTQDFKKKLQEKFQRYKFPDPEIQIPFLPTYDIDLAYSFSHKSLLKNSGGFIKSFLYGKWQQATERWNVLTAKRKDPFDAYAWMDQLHETYKLHAFYFFIVAERPGKYDKNISPHKKEMQQLIRQHAHKYHIGVHPSWQSGDEAALIQKEISLLEQITGSTIKDSRQHYIRFSLPHTFRYLLDAGIQNDFSMGYGSINGFRASVASPFYWFDLEKNESTKLLLYPFCFMDANSFYEQKYSAQQALEEMKEYYKTVKTVNGTMVAIWHNNFLGTDKLYEGWKEAYENFIKCTLPHTPSASGKAGEGIL